MNKIFKAQNFKLNLNQKTHIMGILNITPDSFSDAGKYINLDAAINRAIEIQQEGADILDIGAQSTKPGCTVISAQEELERLKFILNKLKNKINIPISIDTFYPQVAKEALLNGASIINDISGFNNEKMYSLVKEFDCGCIIMHNSKGINTIKSFFKQKLLDCKKRNINEQQICFDPGIGFSKTYEENLYILKNVKEFCIEPCSILIGASRKSVIGTACNEPIPSKRVYGTIAAHTIAILSGANIIRVHDVKEAVQATVFTDTIIRRHF